MKINQRFVVALVAFALAAASVGKVRAQSSSWDLDGDGGWDTDTNWTGDIIADGVDNTATFGNIFTANRIVTLDSSRTIGNLAFNETSNDLSILPAVSEVLTLDVTTGMANIDVTATVT